MNTQAVQRRAKKRQAIPPPKERAGGATLPERQPAILADPGASFSSTTQVENEISWSETDLYLAALVAGSASSPSPETPSYALDVPGGLSGSERTGDSARQVERNVSVTGGTAPADAPGRGSSPGFTWSWRLRRRLLARRRRPS
jgi:hypothetical protein